MLSLRARFASLAIAASLIAITTAGAQDSTPRAAGTHPVRTPISIGNYPNVAGLRLNFRDRNLELVRGINATIWNPYEPATGLVSGLALGLPMTGAGDIEGLAVGAFGVGATHTIRGIAVGGIGLGSGGGIKGIALGGVGVGSGGSIEGLMVGGIGVGAGGGMRGIAIGGIGAGTGGDLTGLAIAGIGSGAGGNMRGIAISGIGAGVGGSASGLLISGIGAGAGGGIRGVAISGIGVGSGATFHGIGVAGVGIGSQRLEGGFVAPFVGAKDAHALVIAPIAFRIEEGTFSGASISTVNYLKGSQRGLTIGLVNYARSVNGAQIGVINIIANERSHPVLPIVNWGRSK